MKTLLIIFILLCPAVVHADDVTDWTTTDTIMQLGVFALLEVDREQTQYISNKRTEITYRDGFKVSYKPYYETNSIIGKDAHKDRINAYFASAAVGHAVISYALPHIVRAFGGSDSVAKYSRTMWQGVWISAEVHQVVKNYSIGVGMQF